MLTQKGTVLLLAVKVVPNSSRTQIAGTLGKPPTALKIKVTQPPEDGRANRAVMELLAETLGIASSQIKLVSGQTHPQKTLQIAGVTLEEAMSRLLPAV
jgi:uncharacterized protein (TIGR00251 family)